MNEIILLKYGEIILKGANRGSFEALLVKELRRRAKLCGPFSVRIEQSTVLISPEGDVTPEQFDAMYEKAQKTFGFLGISRAVLAEKEIGAICETAAAQLIPRMTGVKTFKCEAKRADKRFPMKSPEICAEVGGAILDACPRLRVDVHNPDTVVNIEIRDEFACLHLTQEKAAGGIPLGSSGRGLLLLSGGIDSPVAGYMMAKRGMNIEALHFDSYPYTSELALDKVKKLAELMTDYTGPIHLHAVSLTHIQEELQRACDEDYFTLLLRRFMMRIANRVAENYHCRALITGESLGQVASQTIEALNVTDPIAAFPVFRPCIGLDKEEIVCYARRINTFETSILPYEDCCTVFTPRHPKTRPELYKVEEQETRLDVDALCGEAMESVRDFLIG